jgi:signal recognition particle receptor subunit beta
VKVVRIIQTHPKDFLPIAKSIVFVVDSTQFGKSEYVREAAAMLFDVISDSATIELQIPVVRDYCDLKLYTQNNNHIFSQVIACNRSDELLAFSIKRIKSSLESEISTLRRTRSKYPTLHEESTTASSEDGSNMVAENATSRFTFEDSPVALQVLSMAVKKGDFKELFEATVDSPK